MASLLLLNILYLQIASAIREDITSDAGDDVISSALSAGERGSRVSDFERNVLQGPHFRAGDLATLFAHASKVSACASPLKMVVHIPPEKIVRILSKPESYLREDDGRLRTSGDWKDILADSQVVPGFPLLSVGGKRIKLSPNPQKSVLQIMQAEGVASHRAVKVVLDAGLDLRGCWGDLRIAGTDKPVCGEAAMADITKGLLKLSMSTKKLRKDTAGQSGSTIIMNLKGFIVKNVALGDDPDNTGYDIIRKVMPNIAEDILKRRKGCFSTAIAPSCAVARDSAGTQWVFIRKIELDAARTTVNLGDVPIGWFDLKGPDFAKGLSDGKTALNRLLGWYSGNKSEDKEDEMWMHKDAGFKRAYPQALMLGRCGSRSAAESVVRDALALAGNGLTDYSVFAALYKPGLESECACRTEQYPLFPLILEARGVRLAVGIIDYFETKVAAALARTMSTMKPPDVYKDMFLKQWGHYYTLPALIVSNTPKPERADGVYTVVAPSGAVIDEMHKKDRIVALTAMKWTNEKELIRNGTVKLYRHQMLVDDTGSRTKVPAGHFGIIRGSNVRRDGLIVEWEGIRSKKVKGKYFLVRPEQIGHA